MIDIKFSVITVTYNCKETVERTILSVLSQQDIELEYIIIDGASEDGTLDVLNKYMPYFSYYVSEKDSGIYNAMNKGLSKATGDVVCFLNGDDYYLYDHALFDVSAYFTDGVDIIDAATSISGKIRANHSDCNLDELFLSMVLYHPSLFAQKAVFDKVGQFDERYYLAADYEWVLRAYTSGMTIKCVDVCTTYFEHGGASDTYKCSVEAYHIAIKYLEHASGKYKKKDVKRRYIPIIKKGIIRYLAKKPSEDLHDILQNFFQQDIIIWGIGTGGDLCYQLLSINKLNIIGFIDSHTSRETFYGLPVYKYGECRKNGKILISSWKYEKEIIHFLESNNHIKKSEYVSFSELETILLQYAADKYNIMISELIE